MFEFFLAFHAYKITPLVGNFLDINNVLSYKKFFNKMSMEVFVGDFFIGNSDFRSDFLFNDIILNIENKFIFIFIGINLRIEFPLLNARLRKISNLNKVQLYSFGSVNHVGNGSIMCGNSYNDVLNFIKGKNLINKNIMYKGFYNSIFNFKLKKNINIFLGSAFFKYKNFNLLAHFFTT
jgi:hypothetical protein